MNEHGGDGRGAHWKSNTHTHTHAHVRTHRHPLELSLNQNEQPGSVRSFLAADK